MAIFNAYTVKAPRWKFWAARLFGKKYINYADGFRITTYTWRGVIYVVRYE